MSQKKGYHCQACSFQGRQFPQGVCPACGSAQIRRIVEDEETQPSPRRWSLVVLVALWGYLGFALYDKLLA